MNSVSLLNSRIYFHTSITITNISYILVATIILLAAAYRAVFQLLADPKPTVFLPKIMMLEIFSYLDKPALKKCALICKEWKEATDNIALLKDLKERLKPYGEIRKVPPLPENILQILNSECPFWKGQLIKHTHILFLLLKTVNKKDLTLNNLEAIFKNPKNDIGKKISYKHKIYSVQAGTNGDKGIEQSYWVLMTKDIVPGSKGKSYSDQQELIDSYTKDTGRTYKIPTLLEAGVGISLESIRSQKPLYCCSSVGEKYTSCQEQEEKSGQHFMAGNYLIWNFVLEKWRRDDSKAGLTIKERNSTTDQSHCGAAAVYRLPNKL